ncbi:MAG TPA: type II secretion system F family protein [Candidatus Eisenbacteria bacterium]|jgi:tight adherence protein B|nr:type II secretion system F family protein [Candidatus Eisenbacteria bacterium]
MGALIAILTFLVVVVLILGIWVFASGEGAQEQVRKRMSAVHKAEKRGDVNISLKLVRDEMMSSVPWMHRLMMQWSWSSKLQDYVVQSGLTMKPAKLILISAVAGLGSYLIASYFIAHFYASLPIGIIAAVIPFAVVAVLRSRRLHKFEEHFPEALDLLGRAVRAGHAFTTGLEMISKECPEPLGGEFRTTFEEQNFGLPLRDALLNMTERVPIIDVRFFVTALLIQKETGGNLAEILDGLARVIRDRFRIYREVRVRTAQGRLTAGILIALPIFMMLILSVLNPHYIGVLFTDPKGPMVLITAGVMQLIGSAILWKIIHFEV